MSDPIRERIDWLDDDDYAAPLAAALRAVLDLCEGDHDGLVETIRTTIAEKLGPGPKPAVAPDYLPAHEFLGDPGRLCWWQDSGGYMCCKSAGNPVHA